jgi:nucleoid DNA-binding protein
MKLKELSESVAKACDMQPRSVLKAQMETFRQMRAAVEGGDRVGIPGFGIFFLKETAAEDGKPAAKTVRFKARAEEPEGDDKKKSERAERADKKKSERAERAEKRKGERKAGAGSKPGAAE